MKGLKWVNNAQKTRNCEQSNPFCSSLISKSIFYERICSLGVAKAPLIFPYSAIFIQAALF